MVRNVVAGVVLMESFVIGRDKEKAMQKTSEMGSC